MRLNLIVLAVLNNPPFFCTNKLLRNSFSLFPNLSNYHSCNFSSFCHRMKKFSEWSFTIPRLLEQFPIDSVKENYVRRVRNAVFSLVMPTPLENNLQLVSVSENAIASILNLDSTVAQDSRFLNFVAGREIVGSTPLAHRYGGYQFGYWADQLGDGRAVLLGEYVN